MERKRLDDTRLSFLDAMGIPPARVEVYYLIDFRTQEPVDILPNRHKEELIRYFRSIPWEERKRVKAVCIDTYPVYRDAIRTAFPEDVKICVDHFHLIKEFTQQADEVRLSVMQPIYRELQRIRRLKRKLEDFPDGGTASNRISDPSTRNRYPKDAKDELMDSAD